jgi:biotin carboxylase
MAARLGYPVYIKASFSWAGLGVTRCDNEEQLLRAFPKPRRGQAVRRWARHLLGRDWFPIDTPIDVQKAIPGESAMFCGVAWRGQMLGGYAARRLEQVYPNGPSRSIHLQHHQQMAAIAESMIEAMGFTGFFSLDFILPVGDEGPVLIECNPRVVPISHLGRQIGVDQAGLLVARMRGGQPSRFPLITDKTLDILLFPHSMSARSDERSLLRDIPGNDAGLVNHISGQFGHALAARK